MKNLLLPDGQVPADNKKEFVKIVNAVINQWELEKPVDVMMANRMVASWMKLRYLERKLTELGLFFVDRTDKEDPAKITNVRMNQLAYFCKHLEADFRAYYRVLSTNAPVINSSGPSNFMELLGSVEEDDDEDDGSKKKVVKKKKK